MARREARTIDDARRGLPGRRISDVAWESSGKML